MVAVPPPEDGIYRITRAVDSGQANDVFAPPPWDWAGDDGTFGNRFDDPTADRGNPPEKRFRVIYCATQRVAAFAETLASFRHSLALMAQLAEIEDDESLAESLAGVVDRGDPPRALIPADWRLRRRIGHTALEPHLRFVDVAAPETMQHARGVLAPLAHQLGLVDVDLSSVTSQQRRFTQTFARYVYEKSDASERSLYAGLRYPSRFNPAWECWAVFDDRIRHRADWPGFPASLFPDDPDLIRIARLFNLSIELFPGRPQHLQP